MSKHATTNRHHVGWSWFIRWVLLVTLASAFSVTTRNWVLDADAAMRVLSLVSSVSIVVYFGAQAYELPYPVRHRMRAWFGLSLVATFVANLIYPWVFRVVYSFGVGSLGVNSLLSIPIVTFVDSVITGLLVGGAQAHILRAYLREPWRWIIVLIACGIGRVLLFRLVLRVPWFGIALSDEVGLFIVQLVPSAINAALLGAALWYALENERIADRPDHDAAPLKPKRDTENS